MRQVRCCLCRLSAVSLSLAMASCGSSRGGQNLGGQPLDPQNGYLSAQELQLGCPGLKASMDAHLGEIKKFDIEMTAELKQPPPNVQRMIQRNSGAEGGGTLAFDKIKIERRSLAELRERMKEKKCPA